MLRPHRLAAGTLEVSSRSQRLSNESMAQAPASRFEGYGDSHGSSYTKYCNRNCNGNSNNSEWGVEVEKVEVYLRPQQAILHRSFCMPVGRLSSYLNEQLGLSVWVWVRTSDLQLRRSTWDFITEDREACQLPLRLAHWRAV